MKTNRELTRMDTNGRNRKWANYWGRFACIGGLLLTLCLAGCGTTSFKPYDRTKITKGFTQTEDALADARKYTQDAKDEVRRIKTNSQRIDNKAGVILKYWDKAR